MVSDRHLGIHSFTTQPEVPTGTIRMNCSPQWSEVNPARGVYDWSQFDFLLDRAESWGYRDILYTFCATPRWAGRPTSGPDQAVFGPGTAQPPKRMADWRAFVRAVAERYKGRISGYEVWNEPTSPQFFTGTAPEMGEMTQIAYRTIRSVDPSAYVLSASVQTHDDEHYLPFAPAYFGDLARRGWPVDGIAAHFYPAGRATPAVRVRQIERVQADLTAAGAPARLPLWDTEVNYAVGLPGGEPNGRMTGAKAAAWTVRTFLDSWRTGVRRTYWYLWSQDYYAFPGIQMRTGDSSTAALNLFGDWVIGARFLGCAPSAQAMVCGFVRNGERFTIAWSEGGPQRLLLPGRHEVCAVTGDPCRASSGTVAVTSVPVRISG